MIAVALPSIGSELGVGSGALTQWLVSSYLIVGIATMSPRGEARGSDRPQQSPRHRDDHLRGGFDRGVRVGDAAQLGVRSHLDGPRRGDGCTGDDGL
jgi:hypothetical protein